MRCHAAVIASAHGQVALISGGGAARRALRQHAATFHRRSTRPAGMSFSAGGLRCSIRLDGLVELDVVSLQPGH
jgi:hypothetical protein